MTSFARLVAAAAALLTLVTADNVTEPISTYMSRPDIEAPAMNITISQADKITPGYIFLSPYQATQSGPYIYDNEGNLVWSGYGYSSGGTIHDFHPCEYNGESNYLCMVQGIQQNGFMRGTGMIMDSSFRAVKQVYSGNGRPPNDQHEFNLVQRGEVALITIYMPSREDLSAYGIYGQGFVMQGVFQAVNTTTNDVLFEWQSLDHVPLNATYVAPNSTDIAGDGLTATTAWDYFHINAIDLDENDNYLVSSRHTCSIFCVDATSGDVIWRLNGLDDSSSDFQLTNFNFSFQHDVRYVSHDADAKSTTISIYDNASDGNNQTSTESMGKIITLYHGNKTATMIASYPAPLTPATPTGILSSSQGNLQLLPNGHRFEGFGSQCWFMETDEEGVALLLATFGSMPVMNYRTYKANFTATAPGTPAVYAYAHNGSAPTSVYMSWNGCTECQSWRLHLAVNDAATEFNTTTIDKTGFETYVEIAEFHAAVIAEALDANGHSLGQSTLMDTFVPTAQLQPVCNDVYCPLAISYTNSSGGVQVLNSTSTSAGTGDSGDASLPLPFSTASMVTLALVWAAFYAGVLQV